MPEFRSAHALLPEQGGPVVHGLALTIDEYLALPSVQRLFKSKDELIQFHRRHRKRLVQAGAIMPPHGRRPMRLLPDFEPVALELIKQDMRAAEGLAA